MFKRANHKNHAKIDARKESRIICYLTAVILAILVLIAVIVVLTMAAAEQDIDF